MGDIFIWRGIERLIAVVIAGIAVFLGYKLFLHMPERADGEGKFVLPGDISIYISRVGPGVFFALFGAAIIGFAIVNPAVSTRNNDQSPQGSQSSETRYLAPRSEDQSEDLDAMRPRIVGDVRVLNVIEGSLKGGSTDEPGLSAESMTDLELAIPRIKQTMMRSVWHESWGSYARFAAWVEAGAGNPVPDEISEAARIFRGTAGG